MSLTMRAPAPSAAEAITRAWRVSTETTAPLAAKWRMTGRTRASSSSGGTGAAPGRVDSPPMSRMSAPAASSASPWAMAAAGSRKAPPSEKLSGVTLTMPMMRGRSSASPPKGARARVRAPSWRSSASAAARERSQPQAMISDSGAKARSMRLPPLPPSRTISSAAEKANRPPASGTAAPWPRRRSASDRPAADRPAPHPSRPRGRSRPASRQPIWGPIWELPPWVRESRRTAASGTPFRSRDRLRRSWHAAGGMARGGIPNGRRCRPVRTA